MTPLRRQMIQDMQLRGLSPRTQRSYVDAVRGIAKFYHQSPDRLSENEIRQFFLHLINEKKAARSTTTIYLCGIKFLYETTLRRNFPVFDLIRPKKEKKLPVILSLKEVRELLTMVRNPVIRMALTMIYSCGLRLSEGTHLHVADIDSDRMQVRVRNGKGGKDRYVPLPARTLELLRSYQRSFQPQSWLFPARGAKEPISPTSLQKTFKLVVHQSGIGKDASIHTLRHSYATHLLENGVNLRVIQEILGHRSSQTTALYAHLTQKIMDTFNVTLNALMAQL